jgi:hypothetical protein
VRGNAFWKRHYGGNPSLIGQQVHIHRAHDGLATVIGVLPSEFKELTGGDRDLRFAEPALQQLGSVVELQERGDRWFSVFGVLGPRSGVDILASSAADYFSITLVRRHELFR